MCSNDGYDGPKKELRGMIDCANVNRYEYRKAGMKKGGESKGLVSTSLPRKCVGKTWSLNHMNLGTYILNASIAVSALTTTHPIFTVSTDRLKSSAGMIHEEVPVMLGEWPESSALVALG